MQDLQTVKSILEDLMLNAQRGVNLKANAQRLAFARYLLANYPDLNLAVKRDHVYRQFECVVTQYNG